MTQNLDPARYVGPSVKAAFRRGWLLRKGQRVQIVGSTLTPAGEVFKVRIDPREDFTGMAFGSNVTLTGIARSQLEIGS